ncbi:MAG: threonine--tRNA ligase, partial [Alphaproteobacteria bacterium]|nr:threonine--tRNA ligase [Alphaproteobacteria bacterium]
MVAITLPDGSKREFEGATTGMDIALSISKSLAKVAVLAKVNGEEWDLNRTITTDAEVSLITKDQDEALELLRHDAAHVLAQAVQELFPGTQITFGPATENGFYYDFHREEPFSTDDFAAIEKRMGQIVDRNDPIVREVWSREDAVAFFKEKGETFKAEWVNELPADEDLTMYRQGDNWIDLCRGPHLPSTGKLGKAFKLMKLAGAYWRGDAKNPQLQRIYGTVWRNEKELKTYLTQLEEAEKRDHRKLGREMGLFHIQEEAVGSIFWHPKGWNLYRTVENYMRSRIENADYVEVKTPQLVDRKLWENSGHWDKFHEHMFIAEVDEADAAASEDSKRMLALKPMNCPGHVQIFRQGIRSYKDLPLRMA